MTSSVYICQCQVGYHRTYLTHHRIIFYFHLLGLCKLVFASCCSWMRYLDTRDSTNLSVMSPRRFAVGGKSVDHHSNFQTESSRKKKLAVRPRIEILTLDSEYVADTEGRQEAARSNSASTSVSVVYALLLQPPSATFSPDLFLSLAAFLSASKAHRPSRNIPARAHFSADTEDVFKF